MTQVNAQINRARHEVKDIIHAFHKAQEKLDTLLVRLTFVMNVEITFSLLNCRKKMAP
jgi:hypothetical protein